MSMKTTFIAATTALAIAAGSLVPSGPAAANPFGAFAPTQLTPEASAVEEVGRRPIRRRGHRRHHSHGAAAAAIGLGAFALGAAIASGAARANQCYWQRVKVWSPRYKAYVIRQQRVC